MEYPSAQGAFLAIDCLTSATTVEVDEKEVGMSFLQLTGVTKFYGDTCAVSSMNLSVEKGEFVSLLGPSGCGKTTTLQMVAGFEAVTQGRIELDGRDITHAKANTRGLGIVFQTYALFPHMTVRDNVSFGLEMRKLPKARKARAGSRCAGPGPSRSACRQVPARVVRRTTAARGAGACPGDRAACPAARRAAV